MTTLSAQPALRAEDFVQSLGVCAHLTATTSTYGNVAGVQSQLSYLNIDHVRTETPTMAQIGVYQTLGAAGIKFDLIIMSDPAPIMATLNVLAPYLASIEGPNEVNVTLVHYAGLIGTPAAIALQKALYADVHNDALLNGAGHSTPVLNFTVALGGSYTNYGNMSAYADYANVHAYGQDGVVPAWFVQQEIAGATDTHNLPTIVTETGNTTLVGGSGVTESVQAKLITYTLLDDFKHGVVSTYVYQLEDAVADPTNTEAEAHYGLFRVDGSAKPAAVAIHNLTTILGDRGSTAQSFATAPLTYALSGLPAAGNQMLMEKASGVYDLALWQEQSIWNYTANTEISIAPTTVTVALGRAYQTINVYDALVSTNPIATYHNVSSLQVALGADALVVEVEVDVLGKVINTGAAGGVFASTGADTVLAGSGAASVNVSGTATVTGSTGALTVSLTGVGASVSGGSGALTVVTSTGNNTVTGGTGAFSYSEFAGHDVVTTGTSASNTVVLDSGIETVTVLGATTLTGGSGTASVTLKASGSSIQGGSGALTIIDNAGSNTIVGGAGALSLTDLAGNDVVTTGTSANNKIVLGSGNDTVTVRGATTLTGGAGAATVMLGASGSSITGGAGALTVVDTGAANTVTGGSGAFSYTNLTGNVTLTTGKSASNKVVLGNGASSVAAMGATTLTGGTGAAIVTLSASGSLVTGGSGALTVNSLSGSSTVTGGTGAFSYTDAAGNDLVTTGKSASNSVVLGSGSDTVSVLAATLLTGGTGASKVTLGASGSFITGGAGVLTVTDNKGANTITGGAGALAVTAYAGGDAITTNNTTGTSTVILSVGNDTVLANGATNIAANTANLVVSGPGLLTVNGGLGSMTVNGGTGSDYVFTQGGTKNLINLGSGAATVLSHGADTINASTLSGAAAARIYAAGAASITGGAGLLLVNGQGGPVTVKGGTGAVNASTVGNNSYLQGGSGGGNVLNAAGGNSTLVGGGAGDRLSDTGSVGGNVLTAGAGGATLAAGSGNDTLAGGSGADVFVLAAAGAAHSTVIQGYVSGSDHLSFTGFGSAAPIASQQMVGGSLQLTLADHAAVTLLGVTQL